MGGVLPEAKTDEERAMRASCRCRAPLMEPLTRALGGRRVRMRAYFDIDLPLVAVLAIMERTGAAHRRRRASTSWARTHGRRNRGPARRGSSSLLARSSTSTRPSSSVHILFEVLGLHAAQEDPARVFHRRQGAQGACRGPRAARARAALPRARQDQVHLHRRAAAHARHRRARALLASTRRSPPRGVCPRQTRTCRTSPCAREFGRHIRECFVAARAEDASSSRPTTRRSSLRLLAHLSGDEHAGRRRSTSGADFHASTASAACSTCLSTRSRPSCAAARRR